jgi:hypothetical protein
MTEWKNGDVYERHIDGGPPIYKVIVKKNRRSAVVLRIYDVPQAEYSFAVKARSEGYVGAGYLYSESATTLNEAEYVRSLTSEEFNGLLLAVADALGFEADAAPQGNGQLVAQEATVNLEPVEGAACELAETPTMESAVLIAKLSAERDVYKEIVYEFMRGGAKSGRRKVATNGG